MTTCTCGKWVRLDDGDAIGNMTVGRTAWWECQAQLGGVFSTVLTGKCTKALQRGHRRQGFPCYVPPKRRPPSGDQKRGAK